MSLFEGALLRTKEQLGVQSDKEVAARLGLSATAFSDRKKRDAFPEDKLRALAQQQPELGIDVAYILTGKAQWERAVEGAAGAGTGALEKLAAAAPPTMGKAITTWRENLEMLLDVLLAMPRRPGITGRQILAMADKVTDLEQSGLKVDADMLATMLNKLIKGRP